MNFAVFVSGHGTNLQAIINAVKKGAIKAKIGLVVSDNPKAYALKRAKKAKIRSVVIQREDFPDREGFDREVIRHLGREKIGFIVLAGFMRILSPLFIRKYRNRILNIHPALLPAFKGTQAIKDAFYSGRDTTGVTVHFVDEKIDHGPVIMQKSLKISRHDTLATLEKKIHTIEHKIYPKVIQLFVQGRIKVVKGKVAFR